MTKKIIKIVILFSIIGCILLFGINVRKNIRQRSKTATVFLGLPPEQTGIIKEYSKISQEYRYIEKGYEFLRNDNTDSAIEQFNTVLKRGKETGAIGAAKRGLIDAYEKAREYATAAKLLEKKINTFKVPTTNKFRIPADERLKYIQYAAKGEYDLAIKHAQNAAYADAKLPNRHGKPRADYIERLNDLKAAKDYILSLKKQK